MSIDKLLSSETNRREFLKEAGKGAAGLALLASGCAPTLKETRQDVASIDWDCNPILPILLNENNINGYYGLGYNNLLANDSIQRLRGYAPLIWSVRSIDERRFNES